MTLRSAHQEVVEAKEIGRFEGVLMAVRALRAKAAEQRDHGNQLGAYIASWSADYLEQSLAATVEGTPP